MQLGVAEDSCLAPARVGVRVRGVVQGVGFRPTAFRLATALGLHGGVRNDSDGVWIELQGSPEAIAGFVARLRSEAPAQARISGIETHTLAVVESAPRGFRIERSADGGLGRAVLPPDSAPCDACLAELADPNDRRYRYPFINCTDCGPRYTICRDLPYDRGRTSMAPFRLCAECRREYEDPSSRRFHAEPNACARCGPRLRLRRAPTTLLTESTGELFGEAALAAAVAGIARGDIVAVKGVGGFTLAADAGNEATVARLRQRKQRPHKPFALMARDLETLERVAHLSEAARAALIDPSRPIVLVPRRANAQLGAQVAASVAPGLDELGVMLPSTPLHHLLLSDGPPLMVMTSGNRGRAPIARDDAEATGLAGIADAVLTHDREIHTRADDSVVRIVAAAAQPIRRARGFVPAALTLPCAGPPLLAVGAQLKSTVCVAHGGEAVLSQHLGDLDDRATFELFVETIGKLSHLLRAKPAAVAHDLHPDYRSTRWARASGLPCVGVQHHHAHFAACLAEHGRTGPAIGVIFDGTGCGADGTAWGGEWLVGDLGGFRRAGHLRPIALAGGEAAIREPWRLAMAALVDAGLDDSLLGRIDPRRREAVAQLCSHGAPRATGCGRWFDAVASLAGVRDEISYEGQAAIELEAACSPAGVLPYPFRCDDGVVDLRATIVAVAADVSARVSTGEIAARFHETLAQAVLAGCRAARDLSGLSMVALSGGCFANRRLSERALALLSAGGFETLLHRRVPCGDGGVALGQAAVASFQLAHRSEDR